MSSSTPRVSALEKRYHWQASHSPPLRMASIEQASFCSALNSFFPPSREASAVAKAMADRSEDKGALDPIGIGGTVSSAAAENGAFVKRGACDLPISPEFCPPSDPSFTAPRVSFFTDTVAFSMLDAPNDRR